MLPFISHYLTRILHMYLKNNMLDLPMQFYDFLVKRGS